MMWDAETSEWRGLLNNVQEGGASGHVLQGGSSGHGMVLMDYRVVHRVMDYLLMIKLHLRIGTIQ